jgi:transcriptional regulator with XRE-family HTH domain
MSSCYDVHCRHPALKQTLHPIRRARYTKGWTALQLAQRAGVRVEAIYSWEKGVLPRLPGLRKLAKALSTDSQDLLEDIRRWRATQGRCGR